MSGKENPFTQLSCSSREEIPSFLHGKPGDGSVLLLLLQQSSWVLLRAGCTRRFKIGVLCWGLGGYEAPRLVVA